MPPNAVQQVIDRLVDQYPRFSPQLKRAAQYLLENRKEIGLRSMRQIANKAEVHPNTLIRLAKSVGFDGYAGLREPFRDSLSSAPSEHFQSRARWLQSINKGHSHGKLIANMAASVLGNIEHLYTDIDVADLKRAANKIIASRTTYILGVGAFHSMAHYFWYVCQMALDNLIQLPRLGNLPNDDVVKATKQDVLLLMAFAPYRTDIIEATQLAHEQGANTIVISDSFSSPVVSGASHVYIVPNKTPQFFPSHIGVISLLETLIAFIVADAKLDVVANIDEFHRRRFDSGIYDDGQI